MHVVFVSRELPPSKRCGGIGAYVWDISRNIVCYGHKVTIVCASDDTRCASDRKIEGVRVVRLSGGDFAISGVEPLVASRMFRYIRSLFRFKSYRLRVTQCLNAIIEKEGADLVEFPEYGSEALEWIKRFHHIPMVIRCHGPSSRRGGRKVTWRPWYSIRYHRAMREYDALRLADGISCPSHATAEQIKIDGRLHRQKIEIIPNCVDYRYWSNAALHHGYRREAEPVIFTAGTVVEPKGVGDLVSAIQLLRDRGQNVRLIIAGKWGRLGHELARSLRNDSGLASCLRLMGSVSRDKLAGLYRQADVVCFPSWWENCPYVCLEAMASGALVVGSSAGGMAEIIRDGVDGFLAPPKDPQGLARIIAKALDMPPDNKLQMRREAQNRIMDEFDSDVIVPKMLSFYEQVIQEWKSKKDSAIIP